MPSTLLDNLNSDYLEAFSALLPKAAPDRVLVYVESDEDIAFWRNVLDSIEAPKIDFDVQLPIRDALEKGKTAALKKSENLQGMGLGTHLIVCVDSDYDYLLQNSTAQSQKINESDYIFQTYSYAIENLFCFSRSLHSCCVQATKNDRKIIDLEELLKLYSNIIHELFIWHFHFIVEQNERKFTFKEFCDIIKITDRAEVTDQFQLAIEGLSTRVKHRLEELQESFPDKILSIQNLATDLSSLGLEKDNTYLFVQGHLIKDNVVRMFLNPICAKLKSEKQAQIREKATHPEEIKNQIGLYQNQIQLIENVLNNNTEFKSCFLYKKTHQDLSEYIAKLSASIESNAQ